MRGLRDKIAIVAGAAETGIEAEARGAEANREGEGGWSRDGYSSGSGSTRLAFGRGAAARGSSIPNLKRPHAEGSGHHPPRNKPGTARRSGDRVWHCGEVRNEYLPRAAPERRLSAAWLQGLHGPGFGRS